MRHKHLFGGKTPGQQQSATPVIVSQELWWNNQHEAAFTLARIGSERISDVGRCVPICGAPGSQQASLLQICLRIAILSPL